MGTDTRDVLIYLLVFVELILLLLLSFKQLGVLSLENASIRNQFKTKLEENRKKEPIQIDFKNTKNLFNFFLFLSERRESK